MRIVMVAAEIAPFSNADGIGGDVAALSAGLVAHGHELHAIAPLPSEQTAESHSMAKRLRPILVSGRDRDRSFARFDCRTSSGVEVHLLHDTDPAGFRGADYWDSFCAASLEVLGSLGRDGTWCVSWNAECASVPVRDREMADDAVSHVFVVRHLDEDLFAQVEQALAASDRALLAGRATADACRARGLATLEQMLVRGHACATSTPVHGAGSVHRNDKASAKAALQASVGLPVRRDAPLVLVGESVGPAIAEALAIFLRGDVQVVVPAGGDTGPVAELLERYPDRLRRLPAGAPSANDLLAADGCVAVLDPTLAARAMSRGAVPITTTGYPEGVVDLEPSLSSGSGFVAADGRARSIAEALARVAASYRLGEPFAALAERLPRYTTTWRDAARAFEQLIGATVDRDAG